MGNYESTVFKYDNKKLVYNVSRMQFYWLTMKNGKEFIRIPVNVSERYLSPSSHPVRKDIPVIVSLPKGKFVNGIVDKDSRDNVSIMINKSKWPIKDMTKTYLFKNIYTLFRVEYNQHGINVVLDFQVFLAEESKIEAISMFT